MKVRIKRLSENAVMPRKAHSADAGFDLVATRKWYDEYGNACYGTGLAFEIPEGYAGLLFPRSSNAKKDLVLSNGVGLLDSCYRGEVTFKFKPVGAILDETGHFEYPSNSGDIDAYQVGDRIGQLVIIPYPEIEFEESDELSETDRGTGGYGSSGR